MIIYAHGFGGSGEGSKAKAFRNYFKDKNIPFIAPSLSYVPDLAIKTLCELIHSYDKVQLIGSSLGGFYSIYLSQKFDIKAVLLNPSINPDSTLKQAIGLAPNFYDDSAFEWNEMHIASLQKYKVKPEKQSNLFLLSQKGDELLDYREGVALLPKAKQCIEDGGDHGFSGIERHFKEIEKFLLY